MNDREIKFKVFSFLEKEWIYFDIYDGVPSGIAGGLSEPCQFTGRFDKIGTPIFEGDILYVDGLSKNFFYNEKDTLYFIHFYLDRNKMIYGLAKNIENPTNGMLYNIWEEREVKVLGNIISNKNLI